MSWCNVRVVLHGADEFGYETLHDEMEKRNLSRFIFGDDGTEYHLPPGEYYYETYPRLYSRDRVMSLAAAAAAATGFDYSIRFTDAKGSFWIDLPIIVEYQAG